MQDGEATSQGTQTSTVDRNMGPAKRRKTLPSMLDIAYTAGLLDGEGSIQINPHSTNNGKKSLGLTIQVSSNEKPLISRRPCRTKMRSSNFALMRLC